MASTPGMRNRTELKGTIGWLNSSMPHRERQFNYPVSATVGLQMFLGICSWEYRPVSTCPDLCEVDKVDRQHSEFLEHMSASATMISPSDHHCAGELWHISPQCFHPTHPKLWIRYQPHSFCSQGELCLFGSRIRHLRKAEGALLLHLI